MTVNVGRIAGGHSKNTVPDRVEAQLDLRFRTRDDGEQLVASIRRAAEAAAAGVQGTRIELHGGILRPLARAHGGERAPLRGVRRAARTRTGWARTRRPLIGGGSDASTAAALGIPAIDGLGPRGSGFHTKDERIELGVARPQGAGPRAVPRAARRAGCVASDAGCVAPRCIALALAPGDRRVPRAADVTPQIHVDPGAAGRLNWLATPAPSVPEGCAGARPRDEGRRGARRSERHRTPGRPGPRERRGGRSSSIASGASSGFAESGGNVVDAADARVRKDELGQQFTYFGKFPRQGVYDTLSSGTAPDGSAWVEAKGRELYESKLVVTTRYTLQAPDRALLIETTLENTGDTPVGGLTVGDAIQWGGAEKIAPGKARGFKGPSSGPYVGGVGRFASYAITVGRRRDRRHERQHVDRHDAARRRGPHGHHARAGPEHHATQRVLVVGERPDSASLVSELTRSAGQPVGQRRHPSRLGRAERRTQGPR